MRKIITYILISIIPLVFLWSGANFHRAKYINDPNYIYLMNALVICNGKSVGHIENPGTTVMQIGALTICIKYFLSGADGITINESVFINSEQYLEAIKNVFLTLNSVILWLVGFVAFKKIYSFWAAVFLQLSVVLSSNTLDHVWSKISPEPVLFFITCAFIIAVLYFQFSNVKSYKRYIIIFAVLTGAGLATKATFLPLTIFPFFIFQGIKNKLFYIAGAMAFFVLFTIPAIPEYENMYWWFRGLVSHSGIYGQGEKTIINPEFYFLNIKNIFQNNLFLTFAIGFALFVLFAILVYFTRKRQIEKSIELRIFFGLIATMIIGVLLVAKHYHGNHYLIPIILLSGIVFYYSMLVLFMNLHMPFHKNIIFGGFTFILLIFLILRRIPEMNQTNYYYKISTAEIDTTYRMINQKYPEYTLVNYYSFSLNKFNALKFGDVYAKHKMLPALKKYYSETCFYDPALDQFVKWDEEISLNEIVKQNGNKILMINGPTTSNELNKMEKNGIPLKNIYKGRVQIIYELDTLKYFDLNVPD